MFSAMNIQNNRSYYLSKSHFDENSFYLNMVLEFLGRSDWDGDEREILESLPHFKEKLNGNDLKYIFKNIHFEFNSINSSVELLEKELFPCFYNCDGKSILLYIEDNMVYQYNGSEKEISPNYEGEFFLFKSKSDSDYHKSVWLEIITLSKEKVVKIIITSFFANILSLALPLYIVAVFSQVVSAQTPGILLMYFIGFILAMCAGYCLARIKAKMIDEVFDKVNNDIGMKIFSNVLNLPLKMLLKRPPKKQIKKVQTLEAELEISLAKTLEYITEIPFVILLIVVLGILMKPLFAVVGIYIATLLSINYYFNKYAAYSIREKNNIVDDKSNYLTSYLDQYQHLREMCLQKKIRHKIEKIEGEYHYYSMQNDNHHNILNNISQLLMMLSIVAVIGCSANSIVTNSLSPLLLIVMTLVSWRIFATLKSILDIWPVIKKLALSIKQVDQLFNLVKDDEHINVKKNICDITTLQFMNVSCFDESNDRKLYNANFDFKAGNTVNLIEHNNQTNFLVCDLLMRVIDSQSGKIFVGNKTIKQISTHYLRTKIGFVNNVNHIVYGTVKQNILLSCPSATKNDLDEVIALLEISKDIDPNETIGDLSVNKLSEQIKQKIFLARAIIKKPPILILKDPFFNLFKNETDFFANIILQYKRYGTVVLATSEPVVCPLVDKYLFFNNGLLLLDCTYNDLNNIQDEVAI